MRGHLNLHRQVSIIAALLLAAALPAAGTVHEVQQVGLTFVPDDITVAPGDTVRWVWTGGSHTVTSGDNCTFDGLYFDELLTSGAPVYEFVVPANVAEIPYYCRPHCVVFDMVGIIRIDLNAVDLVITLDGDQEVGPVDTPAAGSGSATYLPSTGLLSWDISFQDLLGTQTGAHFHGPAAACQNGGVQIPLPVGSPIQGSQALTPQQAADVLAGLWYVNIHTSPHPGGEIRGQVMPAPLADPISDLIQSGDVHVRFETLATGLTAPNWGTFAPGDSSRLFVSDQDGILWAIKLSNGSKSVFLDTSGRLVSLGIFGPDSFDERGLLGVAFHPNYQANGLLYTYTSEPDAGSPDFTTMPLGESPNHQAVIIEWTVPNPANPASVVDPNSARVLLRIDEPQFNHNAGCVNFGLDGMLYIALGDGGGADDRDGQTFIGEPIIAHGCRGNGADNETILGTILRIDPDGSNSANGQYGIPANNPFVGMAGIDEIFAYGFRNPFRFSFDSLTGTLYAADVGQNDIEEIDIVTSGGNYGWRYKEGSFYFVFNGNEPGYVTDMPLSVPAGLIDPIAQYDHDDGIAVVGGFAYRGSELPQLEGRYVFGEFAVTFDNDGRLFYLDAANDIKEFKLLGQSAFGYSLLGFGQDADGELYALANTTGTPFGDTGVVLRIMSGRGDVNCDGKVDFGDINPFVLALTNPAGWQAQFPDCPMSNGDINGDNNVDFGDINPFVSLLAGQ